MIQGPKRNRRDLSPIRLDINLLHEHQRLAMILRDDHSAPTSFLATYSGFTQRAGHVFVWGAARDQLLIVPPGQDEPLRDRDGRIVEIYRPRLKLVRDELRGESAAARRERLHDEQERRRVEYLRRSGKALRLAHELDAGLISRKILRRR